MLELRLPTDDQSMQPERYVCLTQAKICVPLYSIQSLPPMLTLLNSCEKRIDVCFSRCLCVCLDALQIIRRGS